MQRRALRNVPGRKDCQWIAELHEHGLLAQLARRAMRKRIPGLHGLRRRFTAAHGQMCRLHLDARDHLTAKIAERDQLVADATAPFERLIAALMTIPGTGSAPLR